MKIIMGAILPILIAAVSFAGQKGEAYYELAKVYEYGNDSVAADSAKSSLLYLMAAQEGYAPAQNYIGFRYYLGQGVRQDTDSALFWIREAAQAGDIKAAGNLGYLLSQAPDVRHDYSEALIWLNKAVDAGLPAAFIQLADMKRRGLGCPPDTAAAITLYDKAITAGVPDAPLHLLAMMGFKWKELSGDSALNLALKYYPAPAPVIGVDLMENAAKKGNVRALTLLGDAYSRGLGINYDHDTSVAYFLEGALKNDPSAQYILAELLEFFPDSLEGIKIESDLLEETVKDANIKSAEYWYEKAGEQGISDAQGAFDALFAH